jgi:aminoglycoside/choline kinase family phosphotransferase
MAGQPLQPVMTQEQVQPLKEHEKEEWRQFLLEQLINFLEQNRDSILSDYESINMAQLSREAIEAHGLLDFDLSITLHQDKKQSFGLGPGFFKANLIR